MNAVSRKIWEDHQKEIQEAGKEMSLSQFCIACDQMKEKFATEHNIPFGFQDNARYVSYIQKVLENGGEVSEEDLKSVTWNEICYDWPFFQTLIEACAKVGNIVEDVQKKKRDKALEWWKSLSEIDQGVLIEKHVKDYFDKSSALRGNVSGFLALHMMIKEGVV